MEDLIEPGAVKHGNFINYYDFNPASERLKLLPSEASAWQSFDGNVNRESDAYLVLDVGCNSGDLTQSFYTYLLSMLPNRHIFVLGIDIDSILIQRANEANQHPNNLTFECFNVMASDNNSNTLEDFLRKHNKDRFDVVCCFSITMWIHLNNGDNGLIKFLDVITHSSRLIIIEPQPWKCYRTAVRRMKRAKVDDVFPLFASLTMRSNVENDIKQYLVDEKRCELMFESDHTKWKRTIYIFRQADK